MFQLKALECRNVLNSHVQFTREFLITLADGKVGIAASPMGETTSIYEDRHSATTAEDITRRMQSDGCFEQEWTQVDFDLYLEQRIEEFGRNNTFALSLAFFQATTAVAGLGAVWGRSPEQMKVPRLCLNVLNGGWHAYSNPVLSDFPEYLLVPKSNLTEEVIGMHNEVQREVRARLSRLGVRTVAGNVVHCFPTPDNRECIEFLLCVLEDLKLSRNFDVMIDASAGDLWQGQNYGFQLTDGERRSSEELITYWRALIDEFGLSYLEDPFREQDRDAWIELTSSQRSCRIIGDNFYSSNAERIVQGAADGCSHGVILKPNQAGTVSAIVRAVQETQRVGQIPITSHRSISTEETFLSLLTCRYHIGLIKIGPLHTDYSSVMRLNAMLRLAEN